MMAKKYDEFTEHVNTKQKQKQKQKLQDNTMDTLPP